MTSKELKHTLGTSDISNTLYNTNIIAMVTNKRCNNNTIYIHIDILLPSLKFAIYKGAESSKQSMLFFLVYRGCFVMLISISKDVDKDCKYYMIKSYDFHHFNISIQSITSIYIANEKQTIQY